VGYNAVADNVIVNHEFLASLKQPKLLQSPRSLYGNLNYDWLQVKQDFLAVVGRKRHKSADCTSAGMQSVPENGGCDRKRATAGC